MKNIRFLFAVFVATALSSARGANAARYEKGNSVANKQMITPKINIKSTSKVTNLATHDGSVKTAYNWYLRQCTDNPFVTKSISAAIVTSVGDSLSQGIAAHMGKEDFSLNIFRLATFFLCGLLYVGPFVHAWYEFLLVISQRLEKKYEISRTTKALVELFVDQTFGVAMFFPAYFYVYECLEALVKMRQPSLASAHKKCLEQVSKVIVTQYKIYPLTNFINFFFVPTQLRVLYSNIVSVFWNIYLCAILA